MKFEEFYNKHVPALAANAPRHYMLLSALEDFAETPIQGFRGWNSDKDGACAIRPTSDFAIMLGELDEERCQALAETIAPKEIIGVMGPDNGPDWFADHAGTVGVTLDEPIRSRIYLLESPPEATGVAGVAREVTKADLALFSEWMLAYMGEALPRDPPPHETWLERWANHGDFLFWTVEGEPVAMAGVVGRSGDIAGINAVYTQPAHRGRGYAGAVTAAAANAIFDEGRDRAVLMVNINNAPAERCYRRLGFQPVCGFTHYWRSSA